MIVPKTRYAKTHDKRRKTVQSLGGVDKLFQSPHFSDEGEWKSVRTDGYRTQISQLNDRGVMSTSLVIENVKQSDITGENKCETMAYALILCSSFWPANK